MKIFTNILKHTFKSTRKESIEAIGGLLSIAAGIAVFVVQDQDWAKIPPVKLDPVLKSVIVSQIGLITTVWGSLVATRDRYEEKLLELSRNIKNILPIDSNVKRTGKILDTTQHISEAIRDAGDVKNTCVICVSNEDDFLERTIKSSERLVEDVSHAVNGGCTWKELISTDAEVRAKLIMKNIKYENNHMFSCRKVKNIQPIINFIILTPKDTNKDKIIYFGFGFHDNNENGYIYATSNASIVYTFESYFDMMFSRSYSDRVSI